MNRDKISFEHEHGKVDGIYSNAGKGSPLTIIINGHNGFYNYGMFPYIQEAFFKAGISSYSFNFSHGGIIGDADYFEDLEKYEKNCMRLEVEDLLCVLHNTGAFDVHSKLILLSHSLGGVPAVFGAVEGIKANSKIDGMVLISSVKTLYFWPAEMIKEWATNGVYLKNNNRTKQDLPQGFEFLQEVMQSETRWNLQRTIQQLKIPILIVHGDNDEAVSVEHAKSLYTWIKDSNPNSALKIIEGASHTFNTKHPFEGPSKEVNELIATATEWIKNL